MLKTPATFHTSKSSSKKTLSSGKKGRYFFIKDPVYKFLINFFYGSTHANFLEEIKHHTGQSIEPTTGKTEGCFYANDEKQVYMMWLPLKYSDSTLAHEIVHLLFKMFELKGVPVASQNQETFAYHLGWWIDEIKNKTKK